MFPTIGHSDTAGTDFTTPSHYPFEVVMDVVDNMPMNVVVHTWFHIASCVVSEAAAADFVKDWSPGNPLPRVAAPHIVENDLVHGNVPQPLAHLASLRVCASANSARERRAGAPVPLEEHAANDRARRVPTANSGASSSGWRRASVAGQSSRRGRDRACERTVADIFSLRAFTGLLDAAADDDDDVRVDAGANGLPERRVGSDGEPRRVRATDAESTENDRLSSENARLREEVARLEGMVDALMMLVDRHGIDASGTGQTKDDAESGDLKSGDLESGDDEEDEEAPPIGDCDSMLEHWLRNHCVPAAAERLSGEREGTPVSAATRTGGVDEDDGEHAERALADSPFEYHAGDEREGEARKMPEEFAKGKITAKKEEALTPEAPTRVKKTFS